MFVCFYRSEKENTSRPPATSKNVKAKEDLKKALKMKPSSMKPKQKPRHSEHFCCLCFKLVRLKGGIGCDFCNKWVHNSCLKLKQDDVDELKKCDWKCPKCEFPNAFLEEETHHRKCPKVVDKQAKAQERTNNDNGNTEEVR